MAQASGGGMQGPTKGSVARGARKQETRALPFLIAAAVDVAVELEQVSEDLIDEMAAQSQLHVPAVNAIRCWEQYGRPTQELMVAPSLQQPEPGLSREDSWSGKLELAACLATPDNISERNQGEVVRARVTAARELSHASTYQRYKEELLRSRTVRGAAQTELEAVELEEAMDVEGRRYHTSSSHYTRRRSRRDLALLWLLSDDSRQELSPRLRETLALAYSSSLDDSNAQNRADMDAPEPEPTMTVVSDDSCDEIVLQSVCGPSLDSEDGDGVGKDAAAAAAAATASACAACAAAQAIAGSAFGGSIPASAAAEPGGGAA